jgi:hypothetical protein
VKRGKKEWTGIKKSEEGEKGVDRDKKELRGGKWSGQG